jgi:D-apiose dehydrogenase
MTQTHDFESNHRDREYRGLLVGAGYFSRFHLDAWQRMAGARIVAVCDLDVQKARAAADSFGISAVFEDFDEALNHSDLDFVDLATPPKKRFEIIRKVADRGLPMICQKPIADDFAEAKRLLDWVESRPSKFMVHENFRFQPWYREIKRLLRLNTIGDRLHTITMRTRMGDGWGADAYLNRQPYFRTMPRLLMHETGIHFADTFRYLAGEVTECSGYLRRLNPDIQGEDAGTFTLRFASGAIGVWDASRYNESLSPDSRYTFGELCVEASGGSLWMDGQGTITIKHLGQSAYIHPYVRSELGFAGDCVYECQKHFMDVLDGKTACETSPSEYLKSLQVIESVYQSAKIDSFVSVRNLTTPLRQKHRNVVDLSLPIDGDMRGVAIKTAKTIEKEGWNATTLELYSHAGTHMDAPSHFLPGGKALDQQDLSVCCGPARVVNLAPASPRQLHTVDDITRAIGEVFPGDRLLLRTDWHKRFGTAEYRDALPRLSLELAEWLVDRHVAMIGVEPPSVADVNNIEELTIVHQTLFRGGILIVEGLANLDRITQTEVEFIALPLNILGGDGCPVRAIAIESAEVCR